MRKITTVISVLLLLSAGQAIADDQKLQIGPKQLLKPEQKTNSAVQPGVSKKPLTKPFARKAAKLLAPTKLVGMVGVPPAMTSQIDGKATINFKITRTGKLACRVQVTIDNLNNSPQSWVEFKAGDGTFKNGSITVPRPGNFNLVSVTKSPKPKDYCDGKVTASVKVNPHAQFPCGMYPGFKKKILAPIGVARQIQRLS